jgi:hypothetical protein
MKHDRTDMFRLLLWGIVAIILFLALSFEPVYGHQMWGFFDYTSLDSRLDQNPDDGMDNTGNIFMSTDRNTNFGRDLDYNSNYPPEDKYPGIDPGEVPDATPPIPEPATLLIFGIGLAGAGIYRTLRR